MVIGAVGKSKLHYGLVQCICAQAVDAQVIKEDDVVIGAVGKMSFSTVWCSAFVLRL